MKNKADFHVHYDPSNKPGEARHWEKVLKKASEAGVSVLALTARVQVDSISLKEAEKRGEELGIKVFSAVEIPTFITDTEGQEHRMDLTAIGFDTYAPTIQEWVGTEARIEHRKKMAQLTKNKLEGNGFSFEGLNDEQHDVLTKILEGSEPAYSVALSELLLAKNLTNHAGNIAKFEELKVEHPDTWQMIQERYKSKNDVPHEARLAYFLWLADNKEISDPAKVSPSEIIKRVHDAGGVVLLGAEESWKMLKDSGCWEALKALGIDGIMGWHASKLGQSPYPNHERATIPMTDIKEILQEKLLILGGSDYDNGDWRVGSGARGNMHISPKRATELEERIKLIRSNDFS